LARFTTLILLPLALVVDFCTCACYASI